MAELGKISDWYRNMMKSPRVEVWLPNSWWGGVAAEILDKEQNLQIMRQLIKDSGIAGFLFGLNTYTMSDEQLAEVTRSYRLMHIQRTERLHGRGDPGDLARLWLIPIAIWLVQYLL